MATIFEKASYMVNQAETLRNLTAAKTIDYRRVRTLAQTMKRELQSIASTARAGEKRSCEHEVGNHAGSRYIRDDKGVRRITRHWDCVKCGKRSVRVVDVTETENDLFPDRHED